MNPTSYQWRGVPDSPGPSHAFNHHPTSPCGAYPHPRDVLIESHRRRCRVCVDTMALMRRQDADAARQVRARERHRALAWLKGDSVRPELERIVDRLLDERIVAGDTPVQASAALVERFNIAARGGDEIAQEILDGLLAEMIASRVTWHFDGHVH